MESHQNLEKTSKKQFPWLGVVVIAIVIGIGLFIVNSEKSKTAKKSPSNNATQLGRTNQQGSGDPIVPPEKIISGVPPYMSPNPKSPKNPVTHTAGNQTSGYFAFTAPHDWQVTTLNFAQGESSVLMQKNENKVEISRVKKEPVIVNFEGLNYQVDGVLVKIASFEDIGTQNKYRRIVAPSALDKSLQVFIVTSVNGSWTNNTPYGFISYQMENATNEELNEVDTIIESLAPKTIDPNVLNNKAQDDL